MSTDVKHVVYTSGLKTHTSKVVVIAQEDRHTEALLKSGGTPFTILRNGWYTENHMLSLAGSLEAGAWVGCAGTHAKFSCAPRADYATAAAAVLTSAPGTFEGRTVELAGDPEQAYTLPQLCEEISRQTGKQLPYQDVPLEDYVKVLASTGAELSSRSPALRFVDFLRGRCVTRVCSSGNAVIDPLLVPTSPS